MKTYKFSDIPFSKEERLHWDLLHAQYRIFRAAFENYLLQCICPRFDIKYQTGSVNYNLEKEEFTFTEKIAPPKQEESASEQPK